MLNDARAVLPLSPVTLVASSSAYFRGFTLIALREGREGGQDDDYAGRFQVIQKKKNHTEDINKKNNHAKKKAPLWSKKT